MVVEAGEAEVFEGKGVEGFHGGVRRDLAGGASWRSSARRLWVADWPFGRRGRTCGACGGERPAAVLREGVFMGVNGSELGAGWPRGGGTEAAVLHCSLFGLLMAGFRCRAATIGDTPRVSPGVRGVSVSPSERAA